MIIYGSRRVPSGGMSSIQESSPTGLNCFIIYCACKNNVNEHINVRWWVFRFQILCPPAVSNLYLTCITDYDMESSTALMFVVVGASMGLFGMVLLVMIKTFQEVKSKMA